MTPVRAPAVIRGDIPGLMRRGMPVLLGISFGDEDAVEQLPGVVSSVTVDEHGDVDTVAHYDDPRIGRGRYYGASLTVDWTNPLAIYAALHYLADRGHPGCLWMLPETHGWRVAAWDGLTAWEVSAILVSVSVGRVAAGKDPVPSVLCPWRHDPNPGDAYESWGWTAWMRDSVGDRGAARTYTPTRPTPDRWNGARWLYYRDRYGGVAPTRYGPETGDAGKLAADTAALADGCCLLVPGGLVVPV